MKLYLVVLTLLAGLLGFLVFTRPDAETILLRAPGALYQQLEGGKIENLYTVKVLNKTTREMPIEFKLENVPGAVRVMSGAGFKVAKDNLAQTSLLIVLDKKTLTGPTTKLQVGVYSNGKHIKTVKTVFVGPRD